MPVKNSFKLLQRNAKSILPKRNEFLYYIADFNIVLVSETWLTPSRSFVVGGFDSIRKDRVGRSGGGVMIMIKHDIKYRTVDLTHDCNSKLEVCAVELLTNSKPICIVSCYRPPSRNYINAGMV